MITIEKQKGRFVANVVGAAIDLKPSRRAMVVRT